MRDSHELFGDKKEKGCRVSIPVGFILLLLSLVVAVGVGLVVFFATKGGGDVAPKDCPTVSIDYEPAFLCQ